MIDRVSCPPRLDREEESATTIDARHGVDRPKILPPAQGRRCRVALATTMDGAVNPMIGGASSSCQVPTVQFSGHDRGVFSYNSSMNETDRRIDTKVAMSDNSPQSTFVEGRDYTIEQGLYIFTKEYLMRRGTCCSNGCRNCPYREVANSEAESTRQKQKHPAEDNFGVAQSPESSVSGTQV